MVLNNLRSTPKNIAVIILRFKQFYHRVVRPKDAN